MMHGQKNIKLYQLFVLQKIQAFWNAMLYCWVISSQHFKKNEVWAATVFATLQ